MTDLLFELPEADGSTLQARIQEMLVNAILAGQISADTPLPSGRKLSQQLGVARNTVVLAYQHLVDNGFLVSRERSGYYVNREILLGRSNTATHDKGNSSDDEPGNRTPRLQIHPARERFIDKPADWQKYPYPFIYGQYDKEMFPVADWRECCRDAVSIATLHASAGDMVDRDDPALIEQIHTKLLPRRGVWAKSDEILVTMGAQHAIFIAAQLLLRKGQIVGIENPGYTDARNIFHTFTDRVELFEVDNQGLVPDCRLQQCNCLYVTPSHQYPTTRTMSRARRLALLKLAQENGITILEDDYESELNFLDNPTPALKNLDRNNSVIYVGSLSKTLAPGFRVGYIVGPKEFIREARALRRMMIRHPPTNNQHIIAQFLKRGYHDALIRRLTLTLQERWNIISSLIDNNFPARVKLPIFGGSAFWLQLSAKIDTRQLLNETRKQGMLFEPGDIFYSRGERIPQNCLRLGFSSIPADRILPGLDILAQAIGKHQPLKGAR